VNNFTDISCHSDNKCYLIDIIRCTEKRLTGFYWFSYTETSLHVKYVAPLQTKKFYHWLLNCAVLVNQYVPNSQRIWSSFAKKLLYYDKRLSRACIVHLVIKSTNWSYVKTMSCSDSHLGIPINIKNKKFVKELPMIDAQFRFNQCNSFREENISVFSHMVQC
jgi:hypothetical protein